MTGNLAEGGEGGADMLAQKFGRYACGKGCKCLIKCLGGYGECLVVAQVRDNRIATIESRGVDAITEPVAQPLHTITIAG